jgi:hypothetical protein
MQGNAVGLWYEHVHRVRHAGTASCDAVVRCGLHGLCLLPEQLLCLLPAAPAAAALIACWLSSCRAHCLAGDRAA